MHTTVQLQVRVSITAQIRPTDDQSESRNFDSYAYTNNHYHHHQCT